MKLQFIRSHKRLARRATLRPNPRARPTRRSPLRALFSFGTNYAICRECGAEVGLDSHGRMNSHGPSQTSWLCKKSGKSPR